MNEELQKLPEQPNNKLKPSELTLTDLMKIAEPLLKMWTDNDNEKHRRELEYENKVLEVTSRQNRLTTVGIFTISGLVLSISGILFYIGRDSTAMDLIKLIIGLGGALLGGYGYAQSKKQTKDTEK